MNRTLRTETRLRFDLLEERTRTRKIFIYSSTFILHPFKVGLEKLLKGMIASKGIEM